MSTFTIQTQTGNYLHVSYDVSKAFFNNPRFESGTFENTTGVEATFPAGTLLARNSTTDSLVPLSSLTPTLGQNLPVGILADTLEDIPAAGTVEDAPYCVGGDVAEDKLVFQGADTLETVIDDRRLKDRIKSDTLGIYVMPGTERTTIDNV